MAVSMRTRSVGSWQTRAVCWLRSRSRALKEAPTPSRVSANLSASTQTLIINLLGSLSSNLSGFSSSLNSLATDTSPVTSQLLNTVLSGVTSSLSNAESSLAALSSSLPGTAASTTTHAAKQKATLETKETYRRRKSFSKNRLDGERTTCQNGSDVFRSQRKVVKRNGSGFRFELQEHSPSNSVNR